MNDKEEWSFVLKQDGLTVSRGFGYDKYDIVAEAEHYFTMYLDEDYTKMTLELKKKIKKEKE